MSEQKNLAEEVAAAAVRRGVTVAVAESLTGGLVASWLAAAPGAGRWFRGALVAYASEVKYELLAVPAGPVVSEQAATAMAVGVAGLLRADLALAVTGVGGPEPQDDQSPGTVWLCLHQAGRSYPVRRAIAGDPGRVCDRACAEGLRMLAAHLTADSQSSTRG
ncbi:MAG: CinA family protein [Streptosporangiales bacterium]